MDKNSQKQPKIVILPVLWIVLSSLVGIVTDLPLPQVVVRSVSCDIPGYRVSSWETSNLITLKSRVLTRVSNLKIGFLGAFNVYTGCLTLKLIFWIGSERKKDQWFFWFMVPSGFKRCWYLSFFHLFSKKVISAGLSSLRQKRYWN